MLSIGYTDFSGIPSVQFRNFEKINREFTSVPGISTDSRAIEAGEVFWALKGENFDAHDFIDKAFERSAMFAVVAEDEKNKYENKSYPVAMVKDTLTALQQLGTKQRRKYRIPVIAVTGSNGKTTVKEMIAHVLRQKLNVHKTEGNFNNHIGCPLTLLQLNETHQAAVIEIGTNHTGEIKALADIALPDQAVITDISGAHLEFFESVETVAGEKLSLFDSIPAGGIIYRNLDNPFLEQYERTDINIISYSMWRDADVHGKLIKLDETGCPEFVLNGKERIQLKIAGIHNIKNALAAAAVARQLGLSDRDIKQGLESFEAYSKRMQVIKEHGVIFINDAYNANPSSMTAAFNTVSAMRQKGKIYLVLGDMFELGKHAHALHRDVLMNALGINPDLVCTMGNYMSEAAASINGHSRDRIATFESHEKLAGYLANHLAQDDIVLIKGSRGMAMEKVIENLKENWGISC
ncbi:MAG: UDP-N-acetylmuramoyl-tripeptide--D-alanyl-D-alanine ligase [Calditrichaceae bacterium]